MPLKEKQYMDKTKIEKHILTTSSLSSVSKGVGDLESTILSLVFRCG